jgi:hypothetical protein
MEVVMIGTGIMLFGGLLTSMVIAAVLLVTCTLIYACNFYCDGGENTRNFHSPWFQSFLGKIITPISRLYFSYTIEYKSTQNTTKANKDLEKLVQHYTDPGNHDVAIFAAAPHDLIPICSFLHAITPYEKKSYFKQVVLCVHRLWFIFPIVREIALLLGTVDATWNNLVHMLTVKHLCIYLIYEGAAGMVVSDRKNPIQKKHKGFLKMAHQLNIPVFPIIHTNQHEVFPCYSFPLLNRIRLWVLARTGYPFPCFFLGPFPRKLTSTILSPIYPQNFQSVELFIETYYKTVKREYTILAKLNKS